MKKENRGGPRKGSGRKPKGKDKRVNLVARVKPETKKKAFDTVKQRKKSDDKFSLGKYLDEIIE